MKLKISEELSLPLEAVTQKLAFLGRTGSGKSYGATKLCELMLGANAQVVALDPVGVWWGLRTGGGFTLPVFGGLHGDIPLERDAGEMVADLIVDRGISAILDVSQLLPSEQAHFAYEFATQFFQRKKASPSPVHLFVEECQEFVPQNLTGRGQGGFEAMMLGAFERLIKLGRNFGIGASLISQRPQEVNKKALNQTECLFAFQMTGPQERKAIESWVSTKGGELDIMQILPTLSVGQPHVWSPQWLRVSKTVKIAAKITADVSSTPKPGMRAVKATELLPGDLEALRKSMEETIEKAKADDPVELRREIARLERELVKAGQKAAAPAPMMTLEERKILEDAREALRAFVPALENGLVQFKMISSVVSKVTALNGENAHMQRDSHMRKEIPTARKPVAMAAMSAPSGDVATGGMRRMMIALAQRPGLNARQLGVRAGLSSKSGTFGTYLGKLRTNGWILGNREGLKLSLDGEKAIGTYTPLPEGDELLRYWLGELGAGAGRMLSALASVYPRSMTKEELGSAAQISHTSGTFGTYLGKLRSLELVDGKQDLTASAELFS